jgi:hypothetical protein
MLCTAQSWAATVPERFPRQEQAVAVAAWPGREVTVIIDVVGRLFVLGAEMLIPRLPRHDCLRVRFMKTR